MVAPFCLAFEDRPSVAGLTASVRVQVASSSNRGLRLGWLAATTLLSRNRERAAFNHRCAAASPVKPAVGCRLDRRRRVRVLLRHPQHTSQALCWNRFRSWCLAILAIRRRRVMTITMMSHTRVVALVLSRFLVLTLDSFQARLKRRHLLAAVVGHVTAVAGWCAFGNLQLLVAGIQIKLRQPGQSCELFWYAAWHRGKVWRSITKQNKRRRSVRVLSSHLSVDSPGAKVASDSPTVLVRQG